MSDKDFNKELTAGTYVIYSGGRDKKKARILSKVNSIASNGGATTFVIQTEDDPQAVMYCKESDITPLEVYPLSETRRAMATEEGRDAVTEQAASDEYEEIVNGMVTVRRMKAHDYGDTAATMYEKYGEDYFTMMVEQKMERIRNLVARSETPSNESIEDSYIDAANYCVMAVMERRKRTKIKKGKDEQRQ